MTISLVCSLAVAVATESWGCQADPFRPPSGHLPRRGTQAHAISRNVIMPPLGRLGFFPDSWEGDPEGTGGDDHDLRGAFAPWTPRSVGSTPRDVSLGEHV